MMLRGSITHRTMNNHEDDTEENQKLVVPESDYDLDSRSSPGFRISHIGRAAVKPQDPSKSTYDSQTFERKAEEDALNPIIQSSSQNKSMVQPKKSLLPHVVWKTPKRRTAGDKDLTQFVMKLVTIFLPTISSETSPSEELIKEVAGMIVLKFRGSDLEFSDPDIVVQIVQLTLINDSAILQKLKEASIVSNNMEDVFVVNQNVIKAKDEYKIYNLHHNRWMSLSPSFRTLHSAYRKFHSDTVCHRLNFKIATFATKAIVQNVESANSQLTDERRSIINKNLDELYAERVYTQDELKEMLLHYRPILSPTQLAAQNQQLAQQRRFRLLQGDLTDLIESQKRLIKVFLHTGYSDMMVERNWIWQTAVPKLQYYGREIEVDFHLVDLNWGMSEEMASDPENIKIELNEIKSCHNLSTGPAFAVIVGNKYGSEILPESISVELFGKLEKIWQSIETFSFSGVINRWYKLDFNSIPPAYWLQANFKWQQNYSLTDFTSNEDEENATDEHSARKHFKIQWLRSQRNIVDAIRKTFFYSNDNLFNLMTPYETSALDEIVNFGIFYAKSAYCICYTRHIEGIDSRLDHTLAPRLVDVIERNEERIVDQKKRARLKLLLEKLREYKKNLIGRRIRKFITQPHLDNKTGFEATEQSTETPKRHKIESKKIKQAWFLLENIFYVQQHGGVVAESMMERSATVAEELAFLTGEKDNYLSNVVENFVIDVIEQTAEKLKNLQNNGSRYADRLEEEVLQHAKQCQEKVKLCSPHRYNMEFIYQHLLFCIENGNMPLILIGQPGSHVSTLVAKIVMSIATWFGSKTVVAYRFLGTTPNSLDVYTVLSTLVSQITTVFDLDDSLDLKTLCSNPWSCLATILNEIKEKVSADHQFFLVLDGLDKLIPDFGDAQCLSWLPKKFPPFIHLITSFSNSNDIMKQNLQNIFVAESSLYAIDPIDDCEVNYIIQSILAKKKRTLTEKQMAAIKSAIEGNRNELFVEVLTRVALTWRHDHRMRNIPSDLDSVVEHILKRLEDKIGGVFVQNALCYLTVAVAGLSDLEWEDVLSCDEKVLNSVYQFISPPASKIVRCPQIFIARLRYHLDDLIVLREESGVPIYFWKSKWLAKSVENCYLLQKFTKTKNNQFYYCNRIMASVFYENKEIVIALSLNHIKLELPDVNRLVNHRPLNSHNYRKLHQLPVYIYNSGPELTILDEYKAKILCNEQWLTTKLMACPIHEILRDFDMVMEKDEDILLVERMLKIYSESNVENPDLFRMEIVNRFSKLPRVNGPFIDKLVADAKYHLQFCKLTHLSPLYHCVPLPDLNLKMNKYGPTHLLEVLNNELALVWSSKVGLEIVNLTHSRLQTFYHFADDVPLKKVIVSHDSSCFYCIREVVLYKFCFKNGKLLGKCSMVPSNFQNDVDLSEDYLADAYDPLAIDQHNKYLVVRINAEELRGDGYGLLIINVEKMKVIGVMVKHQEDFVINNVDFIDDGKQLYVTCFSINRSRENMLHVYNNILSKEPIFSKPFPLNTFDLPGCFHGIGPMLIWDAEESQRVNVRYLTESGKHIAVDDGFKKLVSMKITMRGTMVVLFLVNGQTFLLVLSSLGKKQAIYNSKRNQAICLALSQDELTLFLGYQSTGMVEIFNLPDLQLVYSFKAHVGNVNSIKEIVNNCVITCGSDSMMNHYRLVGPIIGMDFRKKQPRVIPDVDDLSSEDLYVLFSEGVISAHFGGSHFGEDLKMALCYSKISPVIAYVFSGFWIIPLQIPPDIGEVKRTWYSSKNQIIVGLGRISSTSVTSIVGLRSFLTWDAATGEVMNKSLPLTAHECCLTRNAQFACLITHYLEEFRTNSFAVLQPAKRWTIISFSVINLSTFKVMKNTNLRQIEKVHSNHFSNCMLSKDCHFVIQRRPDSSHVYIWVMFDCQAEGREDDSHLINIEQQDQNDFDEDTFVEVSTATQQKTSKEPINRTERKKYVLRVKTVSENVFAINRKNVLIVGSYQGKVFLFNLTKMTFGVQFAEVLHRFDAPISQISLTVKERYIIVVSNTTVAVFEQKMLYLSLREHTSRVLCAEMPASNEFVVTGCVDGMIRVFNSISGDIMTTFNARSDIYRIIVIKQRIVCFVDKKNRKKLAIFDIVNLV